MAITVASKMRLGVGCMDQQCCAFIKISKYVITDIFYICLEYQFLDNIFTNLGFRIYRSSRQNVLSKDHHMASS